MIAQHVELPLPPPPPPRPIRINRLRVIQDGAQDCSTCQSVTNCWQPRKSAHISEEEIVSNLLVCRLQRNIDRNRSTRLFLRLVHPKLLKLAQQVKRATGMAVEDAVMEMQSVAVETLISSYVMGELVPPLVFLFHERYGSVRHWVVRTLEQTQRDKDRYLSYGSVGIEPASNRASSGVDLEARLGILNQSTTGIASVPSVSSPEPEEPNETHDRIQQALRVLEDGTSLSAVEYRILRFCLNNARGVDARMTDWLHQWLARVLDVPRKDVSRVYGIASRKLLDAVGLRTKYLRERGIEPPKRRTDRTRPLTADEIITALELLRSSRGRATILDVAWAIGVTDATIHQLRRRFGHMAADHIRDTVKR
ncbi:hypothetical protein Rctr197k_100 [Virus Rctr197k]|nr:hypothetical protein Rctr197k_100 [Virus Rctr197k]